jgi:SET domain-containing protein
MAHPNSDICVDARRSGSIARFLRRSCEPNTQVREVIGNDNTRRLAVFAMEALPANVELTIGFDRPWKNYSCSLKCACGSASCPV